MGGTGDENPRGKAEEQEGEEENPVEACFTPHARWKRPPIQEDFGRPEEGGDGGGRRLLVRGRFGGVAGGPRKMTEQSGARSTARGEIWFSRGFAVKPEVDAALCGVPGRAKGTGG